MTTRAKKAGLELFESWCRRNRIAPGDPTPAVSSPSAGWIGLSTGAHRVALKGSKGSDTMPALTTTLEVFCLRTRRMFKAGGNAVRIEHYERKGFESYGDRYLVSCGRCSDTHVLLSDFQAFSFGLLDVSVKDGRREHWTRKQHLFGRRMNRQIFDRRKFPPVEIAELERAS